MSNQERSPDVVQCPPFHHDEVTLAPRVVQLTPRSHISIRRTLPHRDIRTIGAWCFLDHYGPTNQVNAMSVAAHPHTGLQTVSWLFSGEIEHRDSIGSIQVINPGELNLMTSGVGIAHSELSVNGETDLHGIQLWIVLPNPVRHMQPEFAHHNNLPVFDFGPTSIRLIVGELLGHNSDAVIYSKLVGAEINFANAGTIQLPLDDQYEYGILVDAGDVHIYGIQVPSGSLHYLPVGKETLEIASTGTARIIFLGGEPFKEEVVMWWNFIGRTHDEIVEMRDEWQSQSQKFPVFEDRLGERIPAPAMPNVRLAPRGNR
ncbi:MAG: pirin family protein [Candidatus Nanopelagicaceae bacterium]|nr:pirin family protein [Candidatus Nanopelagicaceae bacterium]